MHGRKKGSDSGYSKAKIDKYVQLKNIVLAKHKAKVYNDKTYSLSMQMAAINPDFYTLWCYRRCMLESFFVTKPDKKGAYCEKELKLIQRSLGANPKAYGAWHQREWIINQGVSDIKAELKLCDLYLSKDSRNFHCWNYRRFVVEKAYPINAATLISELNFCTAKINEDFSNYSAWHYRTVLIPRILEEQASRKVPLADWSDAAVVYDREFELVARAFYVDPEDQSGWLYHRWLLGRLVASGPALPALGISLGISDSLAAADTSAPQDTKNKTEEYKTDTTTSGDRTRQVMVFQRELKRCQELRTIEPTCKWVLLTIAVLLGAIEACKDGTPDHASAENLSEMKSIFDTLRTIDPKRKIYYQDVQDHISAPASA